jgi:hypothetical protein
MTADRDAEIVEAMHAAYMEHPGSDGIAAMRAALSAVRPLIEAQARKELEVEREIVANLQWAIEQLNSEVAAYKKACETAGVCMTCVVRPPDTFGCSDCLNTGWTGGSSPEAQARAEAEQLKGTLRYIQTQAKSRPSGDSLTLSVIERNADAALNDGFQAAYRSALLSIKDTPND